MCQCQSLSLTGVRRQHDVHFPVPQILEQIAEVIHVILQEQCQGMRLFTFERRVVAQQLLTRVFGGLWFACKGTSDSTGGRAHNLQEQNVEVI